MHNSSCLKWGASTCAINYPHFVFPLGNSKATLLSGNIALNWSNLPLLDWNEYWLHTVSRHDMSLSLSTVYLTSISEIATFFYSGLDSASATMSGCENVMAFSFGKQPVFCSRGTKFYSCHTHLQNLQTPKGLKQMHHAFSALTFFLSHDKCFLSLNQPSWKRDLYSGIKNYDLF